MKVSDAIFYLQEILRMKGDIPVMSCDIPRNSGGLDSSDWMKVQAAQWDEAEIWLGTHPEGGNASVVKIGVR